MTTTCPEFVIPQTLSELESDDIGDVSHNVFRVTSLPKLDQMDPQSLQRRLESVGSTLLRRGGIEQLSDGDNFGMLMAFVRAFPTLQSHTQSRLLDILSRAVRAACVPFRRIRKEEACGDDGITRSQCNALKMATYLLFTTISSAESAHVAGKAAEGPRKKRRGKADDDETSFNWIEHREVAVIALAEVLEVDMSKLWTLGVPDENFINLFCRVSYQLLEQPISGRGSLFKTTLLNLIARPMNLLQSIETQVVATVMHMLNNYEHAITAVADLCRIMATDMNDRRLATSVLREAVRIDLSSASMRNGTGVKHIAAFITEISLVLPSLVMQNISVLLPLLDAEPYILRSAIVSAIGNAVSGSTPADVVGFGEIGETDSSKGNNTMHSEESFTRTRDALLTVLTERARDVNSFTRAAVIKAWISLCEKQVLPLARVHSVVMVAIDRLQDKSVIVRRASMQLLVSLLEHNPFMGTLDPTLYEAKGAEIELWLQNNQLPEAKDAAGSGAGNENEEDLGENNIESDDNEEDNSEEDEATAEQRAFHANKVRELDFFRSATAFIALLESIAPTLEALLRSRNSSDAIEALHFFVKASHFNLPCAAHGLRQSWSMIWSTDASVKDAVQDGFLQVYVAEPGSSDSASSPLPPGKVATNLTNVVAKANRSEQTCLEELLGELVKSSKIQPTVYAALRKGAIESKRDAQRSAAMHVLAMASAADTTVLGHERQLEVLAESVLGCHSTEKRDWELIRCSCIAFRRLASRKSKSTKKGHWSTVVLNHCKSVLRADWCNDEVEDTKRWFAAAEQALSTLFSVSAAPEQDCAEIIKALHQITLNDDQKPICSPASLARFCHVLGGCALHLLIYTEAKAAELKKVKASGAIQGTERATHGEGEKDSLESELGLAAEAELDHDQRVANIIDNEIVSSNLLAVYEPILVRLVANENGKFSNMVLREASVLALCKYMCISLSVCECHLPLLFTTLQAEKKASVRGNIVVALGDLAFRFPNAVEPWTSHIYKRLRDESSYVRSQTLMVLTHLILNDMIKVKGQVSEIVLSLEDEEPQTADLARLFFQELSKRGNNPIYNLMPDIVSRLSQDENVSRKSFRSVMPFLMSFITRDKHSESLVEKLCFRFATCSNIQQTRDVAFCLAQLPINEKALKKLDALIKTYKNALFDDEVHKSFQSLATKAKKFAKPEFREMVQEFSDKLASFNSGNGGEIKVNALGATKENTEGAGPASELPKYIEEDKIEKTKGSNFSTKASESRDKENTSTSTRRSTRVR